MIVILALKGLKKSLKKSDLLQFMHFIVYAFHNYFMASIFKHYLPQSGDRNLLQNPRDVPPGKVQVDEGLHFPRPRNHGQQTRTLLQ